MKSLGCALSVTLLLGGSAGVASQTLEIESVDGGSVTTKLSEEIAVNKKSSLRRSWFIINDPACPLRLEEAGINTTFEGLRFHFQPAGSVVAKEAVAAFPLCQGS